MAEPSASPAATLGAVVGRSAQSITAVVDGALEGASAIASGSAAPLRSLRALVSGSRPRCVRGRYDLDLTYVLPRLMALGMPATGVLEPLYRNPLAEVRAFLDEYHGGRYTLINLCDEHDYDDAAWPNARRVLRFPSEDHHPPTLAAIAAFCTRVGAALAEDEADVVAVHCKAGKGRTGVMVAAYLGHISAHDGRTGADSADAAIGTFRAARTPDGDGVSNPSQMRYVRYFCEVARAPSPRREAVLRGVSVRLLRVELAPLPPDVVHVPTAPTAPLHAAALHSRAGRAAASAAAAIAPADARLRLEVDTFVTDESAGGVSARAEAACRVTPAQCAPGEPTAFELGGSRACGDVRLRVISLGAAAGPTALLWVHLHTAFLPPAAPGESGCVVHFGKSEVDCLCSDARVGGEWRLSIYYRHGQPEQRVPSRSRREEPRDCDDVQLR